MILCRWVLCGRLLVFLLLRSSASKRFLRRFFFRCFFRGSILPCFWKAHHAKCLRLTKQGQAKQDKAKQEAVPARIEFCWSQSAAPSGPFAAIH